MSDESVRKEEREDARNHLWSVVDKILVQLELMEGDVDDDIVEKLKRLKRLYERSKRRDVRFLYISHSHPILSLF